MTRPATTPVGDPALSIDSEAVTQMLYRERQTRDRGWYDEMAECFTPDATIAMSWFTGSAADFIAIRAGDLARLPDATRSLLVPLGDFGDYRLLHESPR